MSLISIPILLGSVRTGRQSAKVSRFLCSRMRRIDGVESSPLDLAEHPFPILENKPSGDRPLPEPMESFRRRIAESDGLVIVAPEYKNGIPGGLKNALDHLAPGTLRLKPVGLCTVSAGGFGGLHCLGQLRQVVFALGGLPIPEFLPVSQVNEVFDEHGDPGNPSLVDKADAFLQSLAWLTGAVRDRKQQSQHPSVS